MYFIEGRKGLPRETTGPNWSIFFSRGGGGGGGGACTSISKEAHSSLLFFHGKLTMA